MASAGTPNSDEAIIEGITNYVQLSGDQSDVQEAAKVYKAVADVVRSNVAPGEPCKLALPSMVIRPDIRTQCIVAIFESRLIVAWQKGTFRKTSEVEVIPTNAITKAEAAVSTKSSTRGALLMTVEGGTTVTFALPANRTDIGDAIRSALIPAVS